MPQLRVGCSGWNYKSWRGRFYPADLPASQWLPYYAGVFDTVEINNTFYRLPEAETFAAWRAQAPAKFLFAVKASRFLTHMKRLRDPQEPLERLFSRATALGPRLGPVLYQLPGQFHRDDERLEGFLRALRVGRPLKGHLTGGPYTPGPSTPGPYTPGPSRRVQHVIEFRHPSWYHDDVYALLEPYRVALCLHDKAGSAVEGPWVGPFAYVRFHGTSGHYHGSYTDTALRGWARRLADQWRSGRDVYAYFNNDPDATATRNAVTLRRALDRLVQTSR